MSSSISGQSSASLLTSLRFFIDFSSRKGYNKLACGGQRKKPGSLNSRRARVNASQATVADGGGTTHTVVQCDLRGSGGGDVLCSGSF
mmetsp:Transcript_2747/g.8070  ORF Transcript_2747/g.8070 Transcript_2747/m.8070 type:complete len:88 (+) Transcript_2747:908-1171(+)